MSALEKARWFGSIRLSADDRLRFSEWTLPGLPHVGFWVQDNDVITVFCGGREVMYLYLDGERVETACFVYLLKPEQLRFAVEELRRATGGLERWIVPALEWNSASSTVRDEHPATFAIIPQLLKTCRELPVAKKWQRVRSDYFANAAARDAKKAAQAQTAKEDAPARKPQRKARKAPGKTSKTTQQRKTRRRGA